MDEKRKALNFDLDTSNLKKYYRGSRSSAYKKIKKFLCKNGFTHRQYSGYNSKKTMSEAEINSLTIRLSREFHWLKKCVNRFDVTEIGEQHDLISTIMGKENLEISEKNSLKKEEVPENNKPSEKSEKVQDSDRKKKALNFDLDTANLRKYYRGSRSSAYKKIKKILCNNGFIHRQYSGYKSKKPMCEAEIDSVVMKLSRELPWLKQCVNRFDVTEVDKQYDLIPTIMSEAKLPIRQKVVQKSPPKQEKKTGMTMSRNKTRAVASQIRERGTQRPKNKNKSHSMER